MHTNNLSLLMPLVCENVTKFQGGGGGGRVVRWCWVNFQCRGVLLIWITVGQGLTALAVGAGGGCLDIFSLVYHFSFLSPFLWETARYRLKYCLKGPLSPKQPTNQPTKFQWRIKHVSISLDQFSFARSFSISTLIAIWPQHEFLDTFILMNSPLRPKFI